MREAGRARRPGGRRVLESLEEEGLFSYALGALTRRMLTERELLRRLAARAEPGEAGEAAMARVIARLKELRYLSDERFAAEFARTRRDDRSQGRRRVLQDLRAKGIGAELAEQTVAGTHEPEDELRLARQYVERKRLTRPTEAKGVARLMGRLVRNGFRADTVVRLLREWSPGAAEAMDDAEVLDDRCSEE